MAYSVSEKFRKQCYSGVSMFTGKLTINGKLVPYSQIKSIKISSPMIDTSKDVFSLGNFISQKLTIIFRNLEGLDIKSNNEVSLEIGQLIDGSYEYCPIGKFLIDDLGENYQTTCQITCLDYAIKFKKAVNYLYENENLDTFSITLDDLLQRICDICEVELGDYPTTNGDKLIYYVNSETSGKEYISYIAELKGCNAKIDRSGKLTLVPLKNSKATTINALKSKAWVLGEKFEVTHVAYFDGVPTLHSFPKDDTIEEKNKIILRQTNPFIIGTNISDTEERVENVYNVVKDLVLWNIQNENYGDPSLDSWDIIEFTLGDEIYYTLNDNELTFEQNIMTKIETKIPTKQQEVLVNVYEDGNIETVIKKVTKAEIDPLKQTITQTIERVDDQGHRLTQVETSLDGFEVRIEKNETSINNFKIDIDGMKYSMTKTGNNLLRNTMFYDFEGWTSVSPLEFVWSDTPPSLDENFNYWYCTKTDGTYENAIIYQKIYTETGNEVTKKWEKTNIQISNISKSLPIPSNYIIMSNEQTRQNYISGRALNIIYNENYYEQPVNALYNDIFEMLNSENELTLSFNISTNFKDNCFYKIGLYFLENKEDSYKYISSPFFNIIFENNNTKELIKHKIKIPKSSNAISVYFSETEPSDNSVFWLNKDYILYKYNEDTSFWEILMLENMLIDQNGKLYYYNYSIIYSDFYKDTEIGYGNSVYYIPLENENELLNSFDGKIGFLSSEIRKLPNSQNPTCNITISDIKLEYGEYSEWSPKPTEVIGTNHLLDETGYKINSGDDEMRLMIDELAQYYKEEKTFYINKDEVYSKNAKSITSDVDGLMLQGMTIENEKIYGRYIK